MTKAESTFSIRKPSPVYSAFLVRVSGAVLLFGFIMLLSRPPAFAQTDTTPPSIPAGLTATASHCGEVDLSWNASTDEVGGSGMMAYTISRSDGITTTIGSARTTFADTNYVGASGTLVYSVIAEDHAGNKSLPSNSVTVSTPACPMTTGESIVDTAYMEPLGKSMAAYGARTVLLYQKKNPANSTNDTWLYLKDSDTGLTAHFLLHTSPGYYQRETDYVLTSATELWTLSCDASLNGKLLVSQYQLNGSPPSSATLISTKTLGDNFSYGMSLLRLQSGALVATWSDQGSTYTGDLITGYAYLSPAGSWIVPAPVTLASSSGVSQGWKTRLNMAQHPADKSVWIFVKEDTWQQIVALHLTEGTGGLNLDWVNPTFITQSTDGNNGPESEFPYLAASPDPTRNAILLGYQSAQYQFVFVDPLYGSQNSIFLKQAYATVAQINADGTKSFIPFPTYMERLMQFGMSVLSDGTIWLAYQPIQFQSLTWNQVYASKYQGGAWSAPVVAGANYNNYNTAAGLGYNPGALIYRTDQPQIAFRTPDQEIYTFDLSNLAPAPPDTIAPTTSITSPANGATLSGSVAVSASASDNIGVAKVELWLDGALAGTATAAPYNFTWNTTASANGSHTLQTKAWDATGNIGVSPTVSVSINNPVATNLTVAITNPTNGSTVPRGQTVTIQAAVSDSTAITQVQFYVDTTLLGTAKSALWSYPWKVPAKRGTHSIKVQAYDATGKTASQSITVTAQ
jgi:hypothetical protein